MNLKVRLYLLIMKRVAALTLLLMALLLFCPNFKYLCLTVPDNGDLKIETNRYRALAASVMKSLRRPLCQ